MIKGDDHYFHQSILQFDNRHNIFLLIDSPQNFNKIFFMIVATIPHWVTGSVFGIYGAVEETLGDMDSITSATVELLDRTVLLVT